MTTGARITVAGAAALVAAAGTAVVVAQGGESSAAADEGGRSAATTTATVRQRDLVQRETLDGSLGFAGARTVTATGPGILTSLAREGTVVRRGRPLYELNGRPVYLLYGGKPAWRTLRAGVSAGADVRQLEQNLVAMGYDPNGDVEIDGAFDWATREAVERWEKDRGVEVDGVVELGEVVFLAGPRRVGEHKGALGSPVQPGSEVLVTSSTRRLVTVELEASQQALVREGAIVRVELPDGTTVAGRVLEVGTVAHTSGDAQDGQQGSDQEPYVDVSIALARSSGTALDQAPVDVHVAAETKRDALAVPVSALVALAGGGYAVEVESGGVRRLVAVETGAFADGYVEIAGRGIRAGTKVVIPR